MGAQKIILKELGKEFGGAGEATATSSGKMKVAIGNLQESVGKALAPTFNRAVTAVTRFANGMTDGSGSGGKFVRIVKDVGGTLSGVFSTAVRLGGRAPDGFKRIIDGNKIGIVLADRGKLYLLSTNERGFTEPDPTFFEIIVVE